MSNPRKSSPLVWRRWCFPRCDNLIICKPHGRWTTIIPGRSNFTRRSPYRRGTESSVSRWFLSQSFGQRHNHSNIQLKDLLLTADCRERAKVTLEGGETTGGMNPNRLYATFPVKAEVFQRSESVSVQPRERNGKSQLAPRAQEREWWVCMCVCVCVCACAERERERKRERVGGGGLSIEINIR